MTNQFARQRLELFAVACAGFGPVRPADSCGAGTIPDRDHFLRVHESVIARLAKDSLK